MAANEVITNRVREALMHLPDVQEKTMFNGLCFMVEDKMCICVNEDEILCRIGSKKISEVIETNGCRQMIHNGKPMKDYVFVSNTLIETPVGLSYWVQLCLAFNKEAKSSKKKK